MLSLLISTDYSEFMLLVHAGDSCELERLAKTKPHFLKNKACANGLINSAAMTIGFKEASLVQHYVDTMAVLVEYAEMPAADLCRTIKGIVTGERLMMILQKILTSDEADEKVWGKNLLHELVKCAEWEGVRVLLSKNADVTRIDADQNTALHWAVVNEKLETIPVDIMEFLTHPSIINSVNSDGNTPLDLASETRNVHNVLRLVKAKAVFNLHANDYTIDSNGEVATSLMRECRQRLRKVVGEQGAVQRTSDTNGTDEDDDEVQRTSGTDGTDEDEVHRTSDTNGTDEVEEQRTSHVNGTGEDEEMR